MTYNTEAFEQAHELLARLATYDNPEVKSRPEISLALASLEEQSGLLKLDRRVAGLCAACFMMGVMVASQEQGITQSEQEQANKCLQGFNGTGCQYLDFKGGALRCKLVKCKFE
jgi:hypothetical protein